MMIILKVFMNTIKKKQSIKPMLYIYGTWVKESDHNEFNYVLESNDATIVRNVCYILDVLISSLCGFAYNESKIKKYKKTLTDLKENYYEEYVKIEKIFKSRVENYELLSGEHYER